MPDRWRIDAPSLAWRQWDDELVLYNDVSGSTHQLGAFGAEVLLCLLRRPDGAFLDDVIADLAERVELPDESQLASEVERVLDGLAALQLAVRVRT
jgi:PqqD family protein of HPr-rel-A system